MDVPLDPDLPEARRLAVAYARRSDRRLYSSLLALDARLGRIVAKAGEPVLAQMRLAWWRDALAQPCSERPRGDVALDALGEAWQGREAALTDLVDGWEVLLGDWEEDGGTVNGFADGRARAFRLLGQAIQASASEDEVELAARRWALADLAGNLSDPRERKQVLAALEGLPDRPARLPRSLRPLAVLDGLARRALRRGSPALLGDRWSPLAAMRLGIFGK